MAHEELGAKVRRLQQAVADVHGHTHVEGVTVRTDANGRLTELTVGHEAWGRGPAVLADLIMRAYSRTANDVQERSSSILAELRDDPTVARIADATAVGQPATVSRAHKDPESPLPDNYLTVRERPTADIHEADSFYERKSWLE